MLYENDDIEAGSNTNSRITQALPTGSYTIEATTYSSGETGEFILTVDRITSGGDPPTPTPTQTPAPTPEPTVDARPDAGTDTRATGRDRAIRLHRR